MADTPSQPETLESLQSRHKRESRDLISQTTALKKTIPKGDKKRKKDVMTEIAVLEAELTARHEREVKEFEGRVKNVEVEKKVEEVVDGVEGLSIENGKEDEGEQSQSQGQQPKKKNRQQLRKERKAAQFEEQRRQAADEASNMDNMKEIEEEAIQGIIEPMGYVIAQIGADGHCLYNAIADQLKIVKDVVFSYKDLRQKASEYLSKHADDFLPFMVNDDGDMMTSAEYTKYCTDITTTPVWGGEIEIRALASSLKTPILVIQWGAPPRTIGEEFENGQGVLALAYHKHYYGLGAHYNSLRRK